MTPKSAAPNTAPGRLKLARFRRLYASTRTSKFTACVNGICRSSVRSVVAIPGPRKTERGELPNVKFAGFTNADVLNHRVRVRASAGRSGSPTRLGRSVPAGKALVVFAVVVTVSTGPD